jgi:adenylate kinase
MVAKIEEARPETDEEPEEVDRDSLQVRLPDDILFKLLQERLNENACRNRGYVLDGFPRTYNNAQYIFLKWEIKKDEDDNDIEAPELGEDEVQTFKGYVVDKSIFPSSVIVLEGDDQFLVDRMMQLPEKMIAGTHYNAEDMERRLEAYRLANNSSVAEPSVQDFFKENQVQLFRSNVV